MKVIWRASLLKNCEQANQCNNSGETEEVHKYFGACKLKSFLWETLKTDNKLCTTETVEGQSRRKTMLIETKSKFLRLFYMN